MEDSILLSIIIPVYNVEKYITTCLDSVCQQDITLEEYEIICVDDFSQDKSKDIVLKYQKRYSNIILVEHEINKNLGNARNTGRSVAKGKYIWNVDSDDYIKPNVLKGLIQICEENKLDVLIFNFNYRTNKDETINEAYPFIDSPVVTGIEFINRYCINNFSQISQIWTQIFNRKFLDNNNIYSPPINMGEDVPFTLKALLLASSIKSIKRSCYVYRLNYSSLTNKIIVKISALQLRENCFTCSSYVYTVIKLIPPNQNDILREYMNVCKYILLSFYKYLSVLNRNELKLFKKICRNNISNDIPMIKLLGKKN